MEKNNNRSKEYLAQWEQIVEFILIGFVVIPLYFFSRHQVLETGFFTSRFGWFEEFCLYGPLTLGIAAPAVRAFTGRRNPARPFEAASGLFLAGSALWFLRVFPFDFTHFADALPPGMGLMFNWFNNDIGRLILSFQILIGTLTAISAAVVYVWKRIEEPMPPSQRRPA